MKIAALYDIHGNLPALEAVLKEIDQTHPDLILVGGDIVSGPMPRATLERLLSLGNKVRFIRGNADREVVAAFDGLPLDPNLPEEVQEVTVWIAKQIERSQRDFLAGLPEQVVIDVDRLSDVLFCHGSPQSDEEIITGATPLARLSEILAGVKQNIVVCGHTHMQFDRVINGVRIVNAGSVGMPYGKRGLTGCCLGQRSCCDGHFMTWSRQQNVSMQATTRSPKISPTIMSSSRQQKLRPLRYLSAWRHNVRKLSHN